MCLFMVNNIYLNNKENFKYLNLQSSTKYYA